MWNPTGSNLSLLLPRCFFQRVCSVNETDITWCYCCDTLLPWSCERSQCLAAQWHQRCCCLLVSGRRIFQIGLVNHPNHNLALLHTTDSLLMHVLLQHTSSTFCDKVLRFGRQQIQPLWSSHCDQSMWPWYRRVWSRKSVVISAKVWEIRLR